jgi:hypothetical protein
MRNVYEILGGKHKEKGYFGKPVYCSSSAKNRNRRLLPFLVCWRTFLVPIGVSEVETGSSFEAVSEVWRKDIGWLGRV